jgi:putative transposase
VSLLHAHLVFVTKYRRKLLTDQMLVFCEHIMRAVCARMRGHLWSPSYFAVSCGGAPLSIIKQYIDGQARPL